MNTLDIVLRTNRSNSLPVIMRALEEITAEIYSHAADEYHENTAQNDHSDERFLTAYNLLIDVMAAIEGTSK